MNRNEIKEMTELRIMEYWDPETEKYEVIEGTDGAINTVSTLTDEDGNALAILPNGKLPVDLTLTGDTELAANVAVQDGTDSTKKLTVNDDGQALVKAADLEVLIGEVDDEPEENTLLARLKSLEDKIDAITAGTTPVVSKLSGSEMEVYGTSLDDRPDATTVPIGATFTIVDASQDFKTWMSNGTNWGEEI